MTNRRKKKSQPEPAAEPAPPTGQTVQPAYFEVAQDEDGWHWQLWAGNGVPVARNAQPYARKGDAVEAIKGMARIVGTAQQIAQAS